MNAADIATALAARGTVEVLPGDEIDRMPCFNDIRWAPEYLIRAGAETWGVDEVTGVRAGSRQLEAMAVAIERCNEFHAAIAVDDAQRASLLASEIAGFGVAVIYPRGQEYVVAVAPSDITEEAPQETRPSRIPPPLIARAGALTNIRVEMREVLAHFADDHARLRASNALNDDTEAALLKRTLEALIGTDPRFVAGSSALELLHGLESATESGEFRDHYFHSFQNFLLGMVVIDGAYAFFRSKLGALFPETPDSLVVEYLWLLTALYHDVGYAVMRRADLLDLVYGTTNWGDKVDDEEKAEAVRERSRHWDSPAFQDLRRQLCSLFEHCCAPAVASDWAPLPYATTNHEETPLDKAGHTNFVYDGHGMAGALRLAGSIARAVNAAPDEVSRNFLVRHSLLAALSIPFHDWKFRKALIDMELNQVSIDRLPLAALLAFIDSLQDDRRELALPGEYEDLLQDVHVEGLTVKAVVDPSRISEELVAKKRIEAAGVRQFFQPSADIVFEYPPEYE